MVKARMLVRAEMVMAGPVSTRTWKPTVGLQTVDQLTSPIMCSLIGLSNGDVLHDSSLFQACNIKKLSSTEMANTKNGVMHMIGLKVTPQKKRVPIAVPHAMKGVMQAIMDSATLLNVAFWE